MGKLWDDADDEDFPDKGSDPEGGNVHSDDWGKDEEDTTYGGTDDDDGHE